MSELTEAEIKTVLEDIADNLFNADPYLQQGGDMVRVGGMSYAIAPRAKIGARIADLREGASGEPVWDVVARYLRRARTVARGLA